MSGTIEHLRACWPEPYVNAATHTVAEWCGWTFAEALSNMRSLEVAGLVSGYRPPRLDGTLAVYTSGSIAGQPVHFWMRPDGAHGLTPSTDPRLLVIGIARANIEGRCVNYQGRKPLEVHRAARAEGYSLAGYSLNWCGPDPANRPQVTLPLGVTL